MRVDGEVVALFELDLGIWLKVPVISVGTFVL